MTCRNAPSEIPPLPWRAILAWLVAALAIAWIVGFSIGWLVRHVAGVQVGGP